MKTFNRLRLVSIILIVCIAVDQFTKSVAIEYLKGTPPRIYLWDLFRLQYAENSGAFLGLGSALSEATRFWILTVAVAIFLMGCLIYLLRHPLLDRSTVLSLSLIIAGGVSNLIDRLFRTSGLVIDFMNVGIGSLRTGIFNVADMAIMLGTGILMLEMLRADSGGKKQ